MIRKNNRQADQIRPVSIEKGFQPSADASCLIKLGGTHVICSVTIEEGVPAFLKGSGQGWITAEYGMLPCATHSRGNREAARGRSGRTYEIQRLIGRALRQMVDLRLLGEVTLRADCDVINADGGTRCASITGGGLAMRDAINKMTERKLLARTPPIIPVAAVSVAKAGDAMVLDPDYEEDADAEADGNFIMAEDGRLVEVQCAAEGSPLTKAEFQQMLALAEKGVGELLRMWRE